MTILYLTAVYLPLGIIKNELISTLSTCDNSNDIAQLNQRQFSPFSFWINCLKDNLLVNLSCNTQIICFSKGPLGTLLNWAGWFVDTAFTISKYFIYQIAIKESPFPIHCFPFFLQILLALESSCFFPGQYKKDLPHFICSS